MVIAGAQQGRHPAQRVLGAPPRTEAFAVRRKRHVENRFHDQTQGGLHDAVPHGRSPSIAPHLALRRRSYRGVRAGERMPGEAFHLSVMAPLQAHAVPRCARSMAPAGAGAPPTSVTSVSPW